MQRIHLARMFWDVHSKLPEWCALGSWILPTHIRNYYSQFLTAQSKPLIRNTHLPTERYDFLQGNAI